MANGTPDRSGLRQRRKSRTPTKKPPKAASPSSDAKPAPDSPRRRPTNLCFVVACLCWAWLLSGAGTFLTPMGLSALRGDDPLAGGTAAHEFSTRLAMEDVAAIAGKPRWIRTKALDAALAHVARTARALRAGAAAHGLDLEVEEFRSRAGSFPCSVGPVALFVSYDALSNVVVRLAPRGAARGGARDALLVNAHVDSAAGSPGASDNAVGAGVALGVLRAMAGTPGTVNALRRPVVFLFNGGEEAVLPAAHAFVTQHALARDVAAHINTESLGAGGEYLLFHLGPRNSWLARAYARAVSQPFASIASSDMFETGVIPGETDFRVFNEFGGIPGYDFVLIDNGFVYHSTRDDVAHVSARGVRHAGNTVLELAWELAGKADAIGAHLDEIARSKERAGSSMWMNGGPGVREWLWKLAGVLRLRLDRENPLVAFVSLLGRYTVVVEDNVAIPSSVAALIASLAFWIHHFYTWNGSKQLRALRMLGVVIGSVVCGLASVTCLSTLYSEVLSAELSWYGSIPEACAVFLPPGLFGLYSAMFWLLPRKLGADRVQSMLLALSVIYGALLALFTYLHVMTLVLPFAYFACLHVAAALWRKHASKTRIVLCHSVLAVPAVLFGATVCYSSLRAFLPIFGRVGKLPVPVDVIAGMVVVLYATVLVVLPTLPVLVQFPLAIRQVRNIFAVLVLFGTLHVLRSVPSERIPSDWKRATFSTDAPRRMLITHFHSPEMEPPTVLVLAPFDPLPFDEGDIVKSLLSAENSPIAKMKRAPHFGTLNVSHTESYRSFSSILGHSHVYQTSLLPLLPVPRAVVKREIKSESGFHLTIQFWAPQSHVGSVRFPIIGANGAISSWSLDSPVEGNVNNGTEMWVRHTGTETWTMSLVLPASTVDGSREKLPIAVSSIRMGVGHSKLLPELNFAETDSPAIARATAAEFLL